MRGDTPGHAGITSFVAATVGVGILMTILFGDWAHWVPITLAIVVSLLATRRIKGPVRNLVSASRDS
jgi:hypothetical protein